MAADGLGVNSQYGGLWQMKLRRTVSSDVDTAREWLAKRNWPAGHLDALPSVGFAVSENGDTLAMAWVYIDRDARIACLAWIMANPYNSYRRSYQALKLIQETARQYAMTQGVKVIIAPAQRGVMKTLKDAGWHPTEKTTLMITTTR